MLAGLITIAGGILAASSLIIARKPGAKELINKIAPYQGWIGVVMFFWGIWELLGVLRATSLISVRPGLWTFWLGTGVVDLVVGFLLGFGLIIRYTIGKNATAQARAEGLRMKLATYQGAFGLTAIGMGVLYLLLIYVL